jgi:hypothetical protein
VINLPAFGCWHLTVGSDPVPLFNLGDTQMLAILPGYVAGPSELTYGLVRYLAKLATSVATRSIVLFVVAIVALRAYKRGTYRFRRGRPTLFSWMVHDALLAEKREQEQRMLRSFLTDLGRIVRNGGRRLRRSPG